MEKYTVSPGSHPVRSKEYGGDHKSWKLYLGGIPVNITEEQLSNILSTNLELKYFKVHIKRNPDHGNSKGCGSLEVYSRSDYEILKRNRILVGDKELQIEDYLDNEEDRKKKMLEDNEKAIHVARISPDVTNEEFENYFKQFGKITRAYIIFNVGVEKKSREFGFVEFENKKIAQKVLSMEHFIKDKPVVVSQKQSKLEIKNSKVGRDSTKTPSATGSTSINSKSKHMAGGKGSKNNYQAKGSSAKGSLKEPHGQFGMQPQGRSKEGSSKGGGAASNNKGEEFSAKASISAKQNSSSQKQSKKANSNSKGNAGANKHQAYSDFDLYNMKHFKDAADYQHYPPNLDYGMNYGLYPDPYFAQMKQMNAAHMDPGHYEVSANDGKDNYEQHLPKNAKSSSWEEQQSAPGYPGLPQQPDTGGYMAHHPGYPVFLQQPYMYPPGPSGKPSMDKPIYDQNVGLSDPHPPASGLTVKSQPNKTVGAKKKPEKQGVTLTAYEKMKREVMQVNQKSQQPPRPQNNEQAAYEQQFQSQMQQQALHPSYYHHPHAMMPHPASIGNQAHPHPAYMNMLYAPQRYYPANLNERSSQYYQYQGFAESSRPNLSEPHGPMMPSRDPAHSLQSREIQPGSTQHPTEVQQMVNRTLKNIISDESGAEEKEEGNLQFSKETLSNQQLPHDHTE